MRSNKAKRLVAAVVIAAGIAAGTVSTAVAGISTSPGRSLAGVSTSPGGGHILASLNMTGPR